MSIRIHELAKTIGLDNKSLLALLKERNFDVKTASSSVDNISAEALVNEFSEKRKKQEEQERIEKEEAAKAAAPKPKIPMVKTAEDVKREKEEAARKLAEEQEAARPQPKAQPVAAAKPVAPAAPPVVNAPKAPPVPVSKPASLPPTPPPIRTNAPKPAPAAPASPPAASPMVKTPGLRVPQAAAPATPAPATPPAPVARVAPPVKMPPPVVSAPRVPQAVSAPKAAIPPAAEDAAETPAAAAPGDVKILQIKPPIIVRDFAAVLNLRPFKLISEIMELGIFASMNHTIEENVAAKIAEKHGFLLEIKQRGSAAEAPKVSEQEKKKKKAEEEAKNMAPRPPIVCILGHVDHGKTSLLDAIRKADVAAGEAGGITQHIGAYQIDHAEKKITFLDTPGHAAFNKMRARGASLTDIAVLVVAADDGFKPQTDEALKYIQESKVSLMVAINKTDVKGANIERVKQQMQERGIVPEDWGGEIITVPVSALKGTGLTDLLDMILLQTEMLDLKANPKAQGEGIIIESKIDVGRGPQATVIIQRGTLRVGDAIVCGPYWARVRAMFDDQGRAIKEAPPSMPVSITGWNGTPDSGMTFTTVKNPREAEKLAEAEAHTLKMSQAAAGGSSTGTEAKTIDDLFKNIAAAQQKTLKVLIKTDVFGSTEAVRHVLDGIKSTKVSLEIVGAEVGIISKSDVLMASSSGATILGFNTKLENGVTPLAKHHNVTIETFGIIYELGDRVRDMMADLLDPDLKEVKVGAAEVRQVFPLGKGFVAGCLVTEGKINRGITSRLRRKKEIVAEGKISALKRFKDDANEVRAGLECGIRLGEFNGYEEGDIIECFEIQKVRAAL